MGNQMFSHYDRAHIATLCEKAGLKAMLQANIMPQVCRLEYSCSDVTPLYLSSL